MYQAEPRPHLLPQTGPASHPPAQRGAQWACSGVRLPGALQGLPERVMAQVSIRLTAPPSTVLAHAMVSTSLAHATRINSLERAPRCPTYW
eukprot:scaffold132864_cov19-Tisochrysis_lutea.AAC.1